MSTPMSTDQESTLLSDGENQQISGCSTYASFGDKGVTATTNSHGHLLQITRYFDRGPSGFFCVDLTDILPSHTITYRMQKLHDYCTDPNSGVGVRIKHFIDFDAHSERPNEEVPKLDFIHDRWPHFVAKTPKFDLETQYLVSEKTVYQIYTLKPCQGGDHPADTPRSAINIELFVRNLSIKADNNENGSNSNHNEPQNPHYEEYSNHLSPKNDYIKRTRKIRNTVDGDQDVIALFITPFINKHPQKFDVELKSGDFRVVLEDRVLDSVLKELKEGNELEVTLAYRLELISSGQTEFNHSVSSESLSSAQTALREPFKIPVFTQDERFNSNLRRNLEHILSVCSIPVSSDANEKSPFIVLTCGDFSGHRISTAASFYAFRFLLLTLEDINSQSRGVYQWESDPRDNNYVAEMTFRILEVCQGHLRWLIRESAKSDATIVDDDSNPNLIQQSLISTSFQIIKAAEFCRAAMSYKKTTLTKLEIENGFRTIVGKWTAALDEKNKGRHFVFPNLREEREQWVFHVSDQAIIWWAAKSAEELALKGELQVNETSGTYPSRNGVLYSSDNIRASLLKRFTVGHSTFEKNMIAVSRSSNETRFQLQAKDTVLFYAMDLGLFDQDGSAESTSSLWQNKIEAWRCVVDYQKECEHDQLTYWDWEQPLRCALALIMSSQNKQLTLQAIPQVQREARNALLRGSSANGLFSSHLGESKGSVEYDDKAMDDIFWSTTFEVPYVILKYTVARSPSEPPKLSITATTPSPQGSSVSPSKLSTESTSFDPARELTRSRTPPMPPTEILSSWESPLMKHGVLFTNIIDLGKIVEIPDEWLYNEPRFFSFHATLSMKIIEELCIKAFREHALEIRFDTEISSMVNINGLLKRERNKKRLPDMNKNSVLKNHAGICAMKVIHGAAALLSYRTREGEPMGYIIDVPRTTRHGKKKEYDSVPISSSLSLIEYLNIRRTPTFAKKRIFHFSRTSWNIALICYLASSESREISCFFDRHASSSPYFFEDTIGTLNKWVTELHLPFYQIISPTKSSQFIRSILDLEDRMTIPVRKMIHLPHLDSKKSKGAKIVAKTLSRAVISFRFDGDLLDRYWTCHLIEHRPQQMDDPKEMFFDIPTQQINGAVKSNPWRQRRVLELLLLDRTLREMLRCTEEILSEAKGVRKAAKCMGHDDCNHETEECKAQFSDNQDRKVKASRDIFRSNDSLYRTQEVLQEVEDDLNENLAKMQLWKNRQDGWGPDKPRWTLKDEYRYGGAISRLQASNNFYMEELARCRAKILAFNSQITREIDASRSDWEMRTTNNVRLFTYVTVVFLPTSFATGVFSMNGIPPTHVTRLVAITAAIALLVTIVALINAKDLERMLRYVRDRIYYRFRRWLARLSHGSWQIAKDRAVLIFEAISEAVLIFEATFEAIFEFLLFIISIFVSLNDRHPIQKVRVDFEKAFGGTGKVDDDLSDEDFLGLFDDLGQRNSGNLFKIWQERLKLWQEKLEQERSRQKQIIVVSEVGSKSGSS